MKIKFRGKLYELKRNRNDWPRYSGDIPLSRNRKMFVQVFPQHLSPYLVFAECEGVLGQGRSDLPAIALREAVRQAQLTARKALAAFSAR